ncbi:MAG: outer membrane lipoprotein-sorting protein [bacterium]|nr:outer membrane lipoprotein-sorting protein [bacterium]
MTSAVLQLLLLLGLVAPLLAGTAASGDEILRRWKALNDGERNWATRQQELQFDIEGKFGSRKRELTVYEQRLAVPQDGIDKRSIVFFSAPPEVKGTAFLAYTFADGSPASQWLYLPALKRVRVLAGNSRRESFVGSDLSYNDLDLLEALDAWPTKHGSATLLGQEVVDGVACDKIELPVKESTEAGKEYARLVLWLGSADLFPRRLEFYERSDAKVLRKRLTQGDVVMEGNIPVARRVVVETPEKGSRTQILAPATRFDPELPDDLFEQSAMERGKPSS